MSQNQCAYCGRSLEVNAKFCDHCGQPVGVIRDRYRILARDDMATARLEEN